MKVYRGIAVSEGYAIGPVRYLSSQKENVPLQKTENRPQEWSRFLQARMKACSRMMELYQQALSRVGEHYAGIFKIQLALLQDEDLLTRVRRRILEEGYTAESAIEKTADEYRHLFEEMDDEYLRAREADVQDVKQQVLMQLASSSTLESRRETSPAWEEPCILAADDILPSETLHIDASRVRGMILRKGSQISHAAILARSLGIPAVAGAGDKVDGIEDGTDLLLDGAAGEVIADPDADTLAEFQAKKKAEDERKAMLAKFKDREGATSDGRRIVIEGNIGKPDDAVRVAELGGEGVGLFRSEFLFMDRDDLPSEDEQFEAYKQACEAMAGKPVIIRTLDIGGDKEVPALGLEKEQNPFLGYRAIRICLNQTDLFLTQLRALLRAAQYGDLRIMFPMISSIEEIRHAKQILQQAMDLLEAEKIPFNPHVKVGIMVEIPVAAVCADVLAKEVDFFSIGTNDLIQYSCAVDRINEKISYLYRPLHPGVLRLIAMTAKAANENGIEVGVCGEMAGTPGMAPVLCGLGVTNLSMSASAMLAAKADLAAHSYGECKELADKLVAAASATDAEQIFADWRG